VLKHLFSLCTFAKGSQKEQLLGHETKMAVQAHPAVTTLGRFLAAGCRMSQRAMK